MSVKITPTARYILSVVGVLLLLAFSQSDFAGTTNAAQDLSSTRTIILSDSRVEHILYGDGENGGHKHGVGTPCKSEFPASWDDEKIIRVTKMIAANDNLPWLPQRNGYHVSEYWVDGVSVRVVLGPRKERVITSYPTNVSRNPCPAPANDN